MFFYYKKMRKNYAVIAAGGLGTRLKDYKNNNHTKVLIDIGGISMISLQVKQLKSWGFINFIIITNSEYNDMIKTDIQSNFDEIHVEFVIQASPLGIADALSHASKKIPHESLVTFVLGDNFFGENPLKGLDWENFEGANLFVKEVENPEEFGVLELHENNVINLHEKPKEYISSLAVVGLYVYEYSCFEYIKLLKPSNRGELEITDLNKIYMNNKQLNFRAIESWWIDAGTEERIEELKNLI
jgi:glucose-1-phosphate thymidylyltransferase